MDQAFLLVILSKLQHQRNLPPDELRAIMFIRTVVKSGGGQREVIQCAVYIDSDLIKNKLTTTRPVQSNLNWIWPVQLEPGCLNDVIFIGVRFNPITCSPCDRTR